MLALPIHDLPTRSASGFLIRYVLPRSFPPQLLGPSDRRALFSTLSIGDTIIGVGHGSPEVFAGHRDEILMDTQNIPDVAGKVVVLISCETAQKLGPAIVASGAVSYIGFKEDLVWVMDGDMVTTPWRDKLALTIMGPVTDCINALLDGRTTGESFEVLISDLATNAELEEDELIKACALFNQRNAVLLGDPKASVRRMPPLVFPVGPPPLPPLL